ncbi:GntR family transcriptional regulator [Maledivibacter halophilus]|uniref:DNA-binding transcriptional regulator, GntR family n=1 Tax=Maledivibacter halophilus TaxID=36842 RepID=A0A1T5IDE5_9FIRM|nr:GntR family transcriptional regulator [Maledivibacter halophilus]SKC37090.1 DNA-binding transcriptional regulator, GntR family [Maledivibacter halophilus]
MKKSNDMTKVEMVYKEVKNNIINCKYEIDEVINEKVIAKKYGISKTPVREAFTILVQEGYLVKYPRLGYYVKELKLKEYYQIVQLRFILESGVIRYVISSVGDEEIESLNEKLTEKWVKYEDYYKVNMDFHLSVAKLLKNEYITDSLIRVFQLNNRNMSKEYYKKVNGDIHKNHRKLVELLKKRDEEGAIKILRSELYRTDDKLTWY